MTTVTESSDTDVQELRDSFPVKLAEAHGLLAGLPAEKDEHGQMMWLVRHFGEDPKAAELFDERFGALQSAYESLAPDASLAPHLESYSRLVRLRALYRHGARLGQADSDFDLDDYRPQTHALVQDAISKVKLRDDLPVYRIDGTYVKRVKDGPGSPEEKAAEVEGAIEFEASDLGEDDPVAKSLLERLERLRKRKAEADTEMLSLLDDYFALADDWAAEKDAQKALGLSGPGTGVPQPRQGSALAHG